MQGLEIIPILFFFGLAGGVVGKIKGSSFVMWFLVSFCVPFIGLACAVLYRFENRELRRQCPNCNRVLLLEDTVCTTCGEELFFPERAIASRAAVRRGRPPAGQPVR